MNAYFLDSSALVKRYITEAGSAWVIDICTSAATNPLFVVRIVGAEVVAAIVRCERRGDVSPTEAANAQTSFRQDYEAGFNFIEVTPALIASAMRLVERHGLRGYDAVQLAAALEAKSAFARMPLTFVAADQNLLAAAKIENLNTENPVNRTIIDYFDSFPMLDS